MEDSRRYDFDRIIDRKNTNSLKYDFAAERGLPEDVLPLWVADMDFPAPEPVLAALRQTVDHGIFGYSDVKEDYAKTVAAWFEKQFDWKPETSWMVKTAGVVNALALAVQAFTEAGDSILIQPPVYYPFYEVVRDNNRKLVENELIYQNDSYQINFADFEQKIVEQQVKLFILCSPHNPIGRVWTKEELRQMADICIRHQVLIIADEIHCDFAFPEHPQTMFLSLGKDVEPWTISCTAPSKTFNLAGLQISHIWIPNPELRKKFRAAKERSGYSQLNTLGLVAARAAYAEGEPWLIQCREYLRGNLDFLRDYLREHLPQIRLVEPQGTYFAWLDCSGLGLDCAALNQLVIQDAKLWLDAGHIFGEQSELFQRVVLACPRETLRQALVRLEEAVRKQV